MIDLILYACLVYLVYMGIGIIIGVGCWGWDMYQYKKHGVFSMTMPVYRPVIFCWYIAMFGCFWFPFFISCGLDHIKGVRHG